MDRRLRWVHISCSLVDGAHRQLQNAKEGASQAEVRAARAVNVPVGTPSKIKRKVPPSRV